MSWIKKGSVFVPNGEFDWMQSHAANPFPVHLNEEILRVYFTSRDAQSRSHIGFVDLDANFKVINLSREPVLCPGPLGTFDDSGVAMGCIIEWEGKQFLYYLGWNLKVTVPWLNTIGLAIWDEKKQRFEKHSLAPVMDRSTEDPYSISYPSILALDNQLKMWYGSNLSWGKEQHEMQHVFKTAFSKDGINWKRTNKIAVHLEHPGEYALSKPFIWKTDKGYEMWYSYRANGSIETYRIGYAQSEDGETWNRLDHKAGIDVSEEGWDSEMICYPAVFEHAGERWMLYNGNGYGRTGFGLAQWSNS